MFSSSQFMFLVQDMEDENEDEHERRLETAALGVYGSEMKHALYDHIHEMRRMMRAKDVRKYVIAIRKLFAHYCSSENKHEAGIGSMFTIVPSIILSVHSPATGIKSLSKG